MNYDFFHKLFNRFKEIFKKDTNTVMIPEKCLPEGKTNFINSLKVSVDAELHSLKIKLYNGEIKAIDLTDEQIDKLQEIYDKEIEEKKKRLEELKKKL